MIKSTHIAFCLVLIAIVLLSIGCGHVSGTKPKVGEIERRVDPQLHVVCYYRGPHLSCLYHPELRVRQPKEEKREVRDEAK